MKSFITDALTRAGPAGAAEPVQTQTGKSTSQEDEELTKILMGLRTNIKIIGCGGGGSNTIDRLYASNIKDADLYAANTDAQHLLVTRAHKKILLGRRSTRGLGRRSIAPGWRGGGQGGGGGAEEGPPGSGHRIRHRRAWVEAPVPVPPLTSHSWPRTWER